MANQRVERSLQKIAYLVGGTDENGQEYFKGMKDSVLEAKQRQHLFWIRNRDTEFPAGTFVLGDIIISKLLEDAYDFEYMGLHENWATNKKVFKKTLEQIDDVIAGQRERDRRKGIFRDDEHYNAIAERQKEEAKARFSEIK